MVEVNLWSGLRRFTDGALRIEVAPGTVGQILDGLAATYPGLGPIFEAGISVAVDGEIVNGRNIAVPEGAEVYLMQRVKGG